MKYSIVTFGCRVNQADSLRLEEDLRARGGVERAVADADVVVVNTCSVTATADQGARQTIRRIARDNPAARIVVTGCYATRCADDVAALPGVVRVVRNDREARPRRRTRGRRDRRSTRTSDSRRRRSVRRADRARTSPAGPRSRCACRPAARSAAPTASFRRRAAPARSLPVDDVVREVERVAASGFKEIALTGVHLGSYGRDLAAAASLLRSAARARPHRRPTSRFASARSSRWTARRRSSIWSRQQRPLRAALPSAAAARERSHAARDAPALHARRLPAAGRRHPRAPAARVDRHRT